jgi:hypothetical protein
MTNVEKATAPVSQIQEPTNAQPREETELAKLLERDRIAQQQHRDALEPRDLASARELAEMIHKDGMYPSPDGEVPSIGSVMMRLMAGRQLGLSAAIAMQQVHDIRGRLGLSAALKRALVMRHPSVERAEFTAISNTSATYVVRRKGGADRAFTFSIEDAKTAGLFKKDGAYEKYPRRMMVARASSEAIDTECPDITLGFDTLETMIDDVRTETPAPPAVPPRDWKGEAAAIKDKIVRLIQSGDQKGARAVYNAFAAQAPEASIEDVKHEYNLAIAEAKKASASPETKVKAETKPGPQPSLPGASDPYLPPHQRGDAYAGPLDPPGR